MTFLGEKYSQEEKLRKTQNKEMKGIFYPLEKS